MDNDLRRIVDALPGLVWTARPEGYVDFINRRWCDYTGLGAEHAVGRGWQAVIHPEDLPGVIEGWAAIVAAGEPREMEARLRRADGEYRWFLLQVSRQTDASGRLVKWCGLSTDVDDRKRAARAREDRFRLIVDGMPALVTLMTPTGELEHANRQVEEYFGATLAELKSWKVGETIHPDDRAPRLAVWRRSIETGEPCDFEARRRRADGVYRRFQVRGHPLRDAKGRIVVWYLLHTDIEDQRRAEVLLAGEKQLLELVAGGHSLPGTLDALCHLVETIASDCFCSVVLVDPSGTKLQEAIAPSLPSAFNDAVRDWPVERRGGPCSMAAAQKTQVIMSDVASDTRWRNSWRALAQEHGLRSCWSTPILDTSGKILGTFAMYYREPRTPTPLDQNLVERFTHIAGIAIQRAQREAALRQSEAILAEAQRELTLTLDSIPAITWRGGTNGYVHYLNKRWFDYTGATPEQTRGARWKSWVHPDDLERLVDIGRAYVASGEPIDGEARLRRFDGEYRWFLFRPSPARDESGKIVAWYGTITDIEDRKRAEEKAREAERELQRTIDTIPIIVTRYSAEGQREFVNAAWKRITGLSDEVLLRPGGFVTAHPEDVEESERKWRETLATGRPLNIEVRFRGADGQYRWNAVARVPLRDKDGNIAKWYSVRYDIEDRKRAEDALAASERNLKLIIDTMPAMAWSACPDGAAEFFNKHYLDYVGLPLEQLQDWGWSKTVHPDDLSGVTGALRAILASGENGEAEARLRRADGEYRRVLFRANPLHDEHGKIVKWYGVNTDIEDRKRAEERIRNTQAELAHMTRVMAMGALTASIAHEVNQPLAGIITNASTCLRMLAADSPNIEGARETAQRTIRDARRASEVITRLRALFAKKGPANDLVDMNEAAREVMALSLSELQRSHVVVRAEFAADLPPVTGDRIQLQQVIQNLLRNALDALREVHDRTRQLLIRTELDDGGNVRLTVQDSGVGFAPQAASKLFEAFYSTKENGMGIGLSISRSIIESHQGRLWGNPNDGFGAAFSFSVPPRSDASSPIAAASGTRTP